MLATFLAAAYTFAQPASASARTRALPKPRLAPVTRTVDPPIIILAAIRCGPAHEDMCGTRHDVSCAHA
jgi:hypothetical protein